MEFVIGSLIIFIDQWSSVISDYWLLIIA